MASGIKRSVVIAGHKTSISLEDRFWDCLKGFAEADGIPLRDLVQNIDRSRGPHNLSSAIRVYILNRYKNGTS